MQCFLQVSRQSGGSHGHPRILTSCPPTHSPPCCPKDPMELPGSSLLVPPHTALHAVQGYPRILPGCLTHAQPSRQSRGSQGNPRILPSCPPTHSPPGSPEDPKEIPGSSLVVPPHTALQAIRRIPRKSRVPP